MKYYFLALGTLLVVCFGCAVDGQQFLPEEDYYAPPAALLQRPGPMVDGPGPGVMPMLATPPARAPAAQTTQVLFVGPQGMHVGWKTDDGYAVSQIIVQGRYNFRQGATYRLKLTNIPGREGLMLYPTLQVYPAVPMTDAYLAHNSVPIEITDEDLDQVETSNFVTKVIYLPDPQFQELAIAGVETIVSTRLDPGVDPVDEADRRGTIMAVLRMGNMDLEMPIQADGATASAQGAGNAEIAQVSYQVADGSQGEFVPPQPVDTAGPPLRGVPSPMIAGGSSQPGMPAMNPVAGMGPIPSWGQPMTSSPIGLPGPAHLPYGGPASLKSHTIRNKSDFDLGRPVKHFLVDVKHEPGYSLPDPVNYVRYEEEHPTFEPGDVAYPRWSIPYAEGRTPYWQGGGPNLHNASP